MKVDIFTLCDSAKEYNGKLVIVGTFNKIFSKQFPAIHPELAIVARICFDASDQAKHHDVWITIKREQGDVTPFTTKKVCSFDVAENKNEDSIANIVVKINNLQLPQEGLYTVSLKVDEEEITSKFWVAKQ